MRQLTASGVWSEAKAAKRLKDSGWIPEDADEAAHAWATTTSGQSTAYVDKAKTQLWNALHKAYLAGDANGRAGARQANDYRRAAGATRRRAPRLERGTRATTGEVDCRATEKGTRRQRHEPADRRRRGQRTKCSRSFTSAAGSCKTRIRLSTCSVTTAAEEAYTREDTRQRCRKSRSQAARPLRSGCAASPYRAEREGR